MLALPEHSLSTLDVIHHMDALSLLRGLRAGSVDAIIGDPPYAEIDRDYGRLTEQQWQDLMYPLVIEARRVLKPHGSAVFILQPNMERLGKMRLWLWEFMVYCGREWNIIQDAYWWNFTVAPTVHVNRDHGLLRPSVKYCVWLGNSDAYRNQSAVLWKPSDAMLAMSNEDRALHYLPSGLSMRNSRIADTFKERGGTTPFNLLPISNANSVSSAGAFGHGAGTPAELMNWWLRYITRPNDVVIDPFMGSGTLALEARSMGRRFIGSEKDVKSVNVARQRLAATDPYQHTPLANGMRQMSLFAEN